jgi:hypothetical protein
VDPGRLVAGRSAPEFCVCGAANHRPEELLRDVAEARATATTKAISILAARLPNCMESGTRRCDATSPFPVSARPTQVRLPVTNLPQSACARRRLVAFAAAVVGAQNERGLTRSIAGVSHTVLVPPGRNDPCYCGSGKKPDPDDPLRADARMVRRLFIKAVEKAPEGQPYFILIDINAPRESDAQWQADVQHPDDFNATLVTNFSPRKAHCSTDVPGVTTSADSGLACHAGQRGGSN